MTLEQLQKRCLDAVDVGESDLAPPIAALGRRLRMQAAELPLPGRRDEEWRYTDLKALTRSFDTKLPASSDLDARLTSILEDGTGLATLVFIDGQLEMNRSTDPSSLAVTPLQDLSAQQAEALASELGDVRLDDDSFFSRLAAAQLRQGFWLQVKRNANQAPLRVIYLNTGKDSSTATVIQNILSLEANSEAELVEYHLGTAGHGSLFTSMTHVKLAAGATFTRVKIQDESAEGNHIANTRVVQARDSHYHNHLFNLGGNLVRDNVEVTLAEPGADCKLQGLYLSENSQRHDMRTFIDHAEPHCTSDQHYRGILGDASRAVFNGRVLVRQDSQQTSAEQLNQNILLSQDAHVDTKPQLEIFADDVRCTHGATVGQLDEEAIFYLRSRGIGINTARHLLTEGFAAEILNQVPDTLRTPYLEQQVHGTLSRMG